MSEMSEMSGMSDGQGGVQAASAGGPVGQMGWFTRAWSWVGGVDVSGMGRAERARVSIVPMLLLVPAAMALAAGFVFALEFRVPAIAAVLVAVVWAAVVFTIDRAFVVAPIRPRWRGVALAVRLVVAGLIGFVVAEPLVAALVSEGIDAQVEIVRGVETPEPMERHEPDPGGPVVGLAGIDDEAVSGTTDGVEVDRSVTIRYWLVTFLLIVTSAAPIVVGLFTQHRVADGACAVRQGPA